MAEILDFDAARDGDGFVTTRAIIINGRRYDASEKLDLEGITERTLLLLAKQRRIIPAMKAKSLEPKPNKTGAKVASITPADPEGGEGGDGGSEGGEGGSEGGSIVHVAVHKGFGRWVIETEAGVQVEPPEGEHFNKAEAAARVLELNGG